MSHWLRNSIITGASILVVIQVVRPARTNPPIDPNQEIHAKLNVEPTVATILSRSCNDCHSNHTVWPWYSHMAPASWLLVWDVNRGRKALNLSEWSMYQPEAQRKQLTEICKEVSEGEMPGISYTLLHRHARLSPSDVTAVCSWTKNTTQNLSATTVEE
jgi:hypothetical protein